MNLPRKPPSKPVDAFCKPGRSPRALPMARSDLANGPLPAQSLRSCPTPQSLPLAPVATGQLIPSSLHRQGEHLQATRVVSLLRSCPTAPRGAVSLSNDALRAGHGPDEGLPAWPVVAQLPNSAIPGAGGYRTAHPIVPPP